MTPAMSARWAGDDTACAGDVLLWAGNLLLLEGLGVGRPGGLETGIVTEGSVALREGDGEDLTSLEGADLTGLDGDSPAVGGATAQPHSSADTTHEHRRPGFSDLCDRKSLTGRPRSPKLVVRREFSPSRLLGLR